LEKANEVFKLNVENSVEFVFLEKRWLVDDHTYPHFTLIGQSLGAVGLGFEAISKCVPNLFIGNFK